MIDLDESGTPKTLEANDYVMARNMAEALHRHYPDQMWAVTCEGSKGIATVRNLCLSGTWGYVLRLPLVYSASAFERDVLRAGGEILERFRLARGKFDHDAYAGLKTNFAGRLEFDT